MLRARDAAGQLVGCILPDVGGGHWPLGSLGLLAEYPGQRLGGME